MILNFIWLLFSHYIGDIALQSPWQAENKGKYWYVLLSHSMIWGGCVCIALFYLGRFDYWDVPILVLGHMIIDKIKSSMPRTEKNWWMIYPDQLAHIGQLIVVYLI